MDLEFSGASSGDSSEIGFDNKTKSSEKLKVSFEKDVFKCWCYFLLGNMHKIQMKQHKSNFIKDGVLVDTQNIQEEQTL